MIDYCDKKKSDLVNINQFSLINFGDGDVVFRRDCKSALQDEKHKTITSAAFSFLLGKSKHTGQTKPSRENDFTA